MAENENFQLPEPLDNSQSPTFSGGREFKARSIGEAFIKNAALTAATAVLFKRSTGLKGSTTAEFQITPTRTETHDITSMLGTPVFAQVQIQGGQFFELEDVNGENPIEYEGIVMQTILVDVSMTKNIVKTPIQGLDGTIKEYVSQGDFIINMTGNIVGRTEGNTVVGIGQVFPRIDTERLIQICGVPQSLIITSEFLQLFGINEVVVSGYKFAEKEGFRNMQPFQISMLSDKPINLEEI